MRNTGSLPKVVLIGTDAEDEGLIRQHLGSGKGAIVQVTRGFGSFLAGVSHLAGKDTKLPDAVYIDNSTCMALSDMTNGSKKVADEVVRKTRLGTDLTLIIVEDPFGPLIGPIFTAKGLPVFCGSIPAAMFAIEHGTGT